MRRATVLGLILLLSSCGDADGAASEPDRQTDDTVLVPATVLLDLDETLPDDAGGVDLGALGPADDLTFCEAFAAAPTRWIDDAIVPLQFWIDAYSGVDDEPPQASEPLAAVRAYAQDKLDWNFKRLDERPVYDETIARHAVALADAAVDSCPDLPLVVGLNQAGQPPTWWADETDAAIDAMCAEFVREVEQGIAAYVERNGRQPGHAEQLDSEAYVAWAFGDADLWFANEYVGVRRDDAGIAQAVVVPGGGCDR